MDIDIPVGKALVPVKNKNPDKSCDGCFFEDDNETKKNSPCKGLMCWDFDRKDGKNVIFKIIDIKENSDGH